MKTRRLIAKVILNIHNNTISYCCSHDRQWPLSIDAYHGSLESIVGIPIYPCDVEVVGHSGSRCENRCRQEKPHWDHAEANGKPTKPEVLDVFVVESGFRGALFLIRYFEVMRASDLASVIGCYRD